MAGAYCLVATHKYKLIKQWICNADERDKLGRFFYHQIWRCERCGHEKTTKTGSW